MGVVEVTQPTPLPTDEIILKLRYLAACVSHQHPHGVAHRRDIRDIVDRQFDYSDDLRRRYVDRVISYLDATVDQRQVVTWDPGRRHPFPALTERQAAPVMQELER